MGTNKIIYKKTALILFIMFFGYQSVFSQEELEDDSNDFWEHVRFGGGLGLDFGNGFFTATIAPSAIYEFNNTFSLGTGLSATFNSLKNNYTSTILGGSIIGLVNVIPQIQISAEYEQLHLNRKYNVNLNVDNDAYWVPALYIGAGYRNGNVTFGVRYDVLFDNQNSISLDAWAPFVRFYF